MPKKLMSKLVIIKRASIPIPDNQEPSTSGLFSHSGKKIRPLGLLTGRSSKKTKSKKTGKTKKRR